ncbi:hypothetical protein TURU_129774 [Turdus rufiventris]|nr:hypothetical protein TURU_129774 [Turdus rufiventris]
MSLSQACDERKNSELNVIIRDSAPEVIAITPLMTSMEMIPKHPKKSRDKRLSDEITPAWKFRDGTRDLKSDFQAEVQACCLMPKLILNYTE